MPCAGILTRADWPWRQCADWRRGGASSSYRAAEPLADEVRVAQRAQGFSDDIAHWMAILAMDQLGRSIAAELEGAQLIHLRNEVDPVHDAGKVPVLAPHTWMRASDPLPHSWDITSDSIAAFIAGALGASELILLKPVDGPVGALVDRGFAATCPPGMRVRIATPATLAAGERAMTTVHGVTQPRHAFPRQRFRSGLHRTPPRGRQPRAGGSRRATPRRRWSCHRPGPARCPGAPRCRRSAMRPSNVDGCEEVAPLLAARVEQQTPGPGRGTHIDPVGQVDRIFRSVDISSHDEARDRSGRASSSRTAAATAGAAACSRRRHQRRLEVQRLSSLQRRHGSNELGQGRSGRASPSATLRGIDSGTASQMDGGYRAKRERAARARVPWRR